MKLLVGLGNPGPRYAPTRHNVGFRIAERWARRTGIALAEQRFGGLYGAGSLARPESEPLAVGALEPLSWMNRSGEALAAAVAGLGLTDPASELLLVFDDVDLPFGRLRLRPRGGAGGHRGVADVIEALGHSDFPRLRFGVGRPEGALDTADWVLEPFSEDEEQRLPERLEAACDAVDAALLDGVGPAMNRFNRDPAPEAPEPVK